MKILFDFFPIILFFAAFKLADIYVATAVAIAATVGQVVYVKWRSRRVEPAQWLSFGVIVVFGGATLYLQDEVFIKWKPTAVYWLMACALILGQLFWKKNFIKILLTSSQMNLPETVWRTLNWSWTAFFMVMGGLNVWVAYSFETDVWVNFKMFGGMGLMFVFVVIQSLYLARFMDPVDQKSSE